MNCVWVLEQGVGVYKSGYYEVAIPATSSSTTATDLAWLQRQKLLTPGTSSSVDWTTGGRPSGSIQNEVGTDTDDLVQVYDCFASPAHCRLYRIKVGVLLGRHSDVPA